MSTVGFDAARYSHPLISERAIDEARKLRVIYIGAGVSGIDAAIQFPKYVPNIDLQIYEKNADVGGTWFENRYPGCACDIPAHSYQLSFESNVDWSSFYAGAPEILRYWQRIADKYALRRYMKFHHRCLGAKWNEDTSKWHVRLHNLETNEEFEDVGDVLVTGTGVLNQWRWPDIKGLHDYKGTLLHSADWNPSFEATDKTVAVIGAGSSGIQIVPALQPKVKALDHYVRGRTWIASSFGSELVKERNDGKDGNFNYTDQERQKWREDPASYIKYRKRLEVGMQGGFAITHRDTAAHAEAWSAFGEDMRARLERKPEIIEHLLPRFPPLCKRLTPGPGYLEALTAENVNVIADEIDHFDATGIVTKDGTHRAVDAIVCATGFDTSFQGRFPVIGRHGENLQERYRMRPETYLGICTDNFPNFYQSLGPNTGVGNGSLLVIVEAIQKYIGQVLQKLATDNVLTIEPKREAVQNFTEYCDAFFKRTVFSAECGSWYKTSPPNATAEERKRGRVSALWPGSSVHAVKALERPRWEDFEMTVADGNKFGWFGDGWSVAERTADAEGLSYYLNDTRMLHEDLYHTNEAKGMNGAAGINGAKLMNGAEGINGAKAVHGGDGINGADM